jgi:hypothetical protein
MVLPAFKGSVGIDDLASNGNGGGIIYEDLGSESISLLVKMLDVL